MGSPGVTLRVHAGLGSWGPAEGTHWDHGAGLGVLRQTPHPHPRVHGCHVLTLMAASRAQRVSPASLIYAKVPDRSRGPGATVPTHG